MIVMPANCQGWYWHCLARETGKLGHLYSPAGKAGPWPWFPYACDNGCYSLWTPETNEFDESRWKLNGYDEWRRLMFWCEAAAQKPIWAIIPDRPGNWDITIEKWMKYSGESPFPLALAVQDGATVEAVKQLTPKPEVICVGGSTDWKWNTVEMWAANFPRVHLLRCNTPAKLYYLEALGIESCDGTGWLRGDRKKVQGLEDWARQSPAPIAPDITPFAFRAKENKKQMEFA